MQLFRVCVSEAVRCQCKRLMWAALDWNQRARDFYLRLGALKMSEWIPFRLTEQGLTQFIEKFGDDKQVRSDL